MSKTVYRCDYCDKVFTNEAEAATHETICGCNPSNKITDYRVLRLSMLLYELDAICAVVMSEIEAQESLRFIKSEFRRATKENCPFMVYDYKRVGAEIMRLALDCEDNPTNTKWNKEHYPELVQAIKETLTRPAWNERR